MSQAAYYNGYDDAVAELTPKIRALEARLAAQTPEGGSTTQRTYPSVFKTIVSDDVTGFGIAAVEAELGSILENDSLLPQITSVVDRVDADNSIIYMTTPPSGGWVPGDKIIGSLTLMNRGNNAMLYIDGAQVFDEPVMRISSLFALTYKVVTGQPTWQMTSSH